MRWQITILMLWVTASLLGQGRRQDLSYSGYLLHLGDDEQMTVSNLKSRQYRVKPLDGGSVPKSAVEYLVQKENLDTVGVVTFRSGKLVKAYRNWTPAEHSQYAFVIAIRGAFDALKVETGCKLNTAEVGEPNYSNKSSQIVCGNKALEISGMESPQITGKTAVMIYEWLSDGSSN